MSYAKTPEGKLKEKANKKKYYLEHRAEILARAKRWNLANLVKRRVHGKKYRLKRQILDEIHEQSN